MFLAAHSTACMSTKRFYLLSDSKTKFVFPARLAQLIATLLTCEISTPGCLYNYKHSPDVGYAASAHYTHDRFKMGGHLKRTAFKTAGTVTVFYTPPLLNRISLMQHFLCIFKCSDVFF